MEKNTATTDGLTIRSAMAGDIPTIQSLLKDSGLPWEDVAEHTANFLVAVSKERIVGAVGLEVVGKSALLRSLVIAESLRGRGLGKALYDAVMDRSRTLGIREIGLLTTTAEGFFSRFGFHKQSDIPTFVAGTKEYKDFCPSSAVCMMKTLGER